MAGSEAVGDTPASESLTLVQVWRWQNIFLGLEWEIESLIIMVIMVIMVIMMTSLWRSFQGKRRIRRIRGVRGILLLRFWAAAEGRAVIAMAMAVVMAMAVEMGIATAVATAMMAVTGT